ncbi:cytosol aminopeptidase-like [Galleria mellonella]|uniref:Cytosol aminopeptidase n=1 Tax=Galleria mellonella TaxID=7137 RepID=A0ABM3MW81_GALME|nr:cytosol aminopeptidase-like [Galleria mellonella]
MQFTKLFSCIKFVPKEFNSVRVVSRSYCAGTPQESTCSVEESNQANNLDGSKKGLVVGVYESGKKFELTPTAEEINQKTNGKLCKYLNELSSQLKLGKAFTVTDLLPEYSAVAITCFGPKDPGYNKLEELDETKENVRWGVGAGVRELQARGVGHIDVEPAASCRAAAEAAELAAWRFQEFSSCKEPKSRVSLYTGEDSRDESLTSEWNEGAEFGRAQNWARFLSDMPANKMTPVDLAQAALDTLCPLGVRVEVREGAWVEAAGLRALQAAARGGGGGALLLECSLARAATAAPPVLLAATGVTFDSGGLCLRRGRDLAAGHAAMAGAAATLAAMRTIAKLKVPLNVVAVIPLCENMISGQCMKVGDVVQALNGIYMQIEDTDNEGHLMLADALVYGQAVHKPSLVIDVATLTKGVMVATGGGAYGCFSSCERAWRTLQHAGAITGDRPWRLPLWEYYHRQLTDDPSVDLRNKGSGKATSCLGAAFLRRFVCCDWLHLDTRGVERGGPPYLRGRRMSGRPARPLALALQLIAQESSATPPAAAAT